MQAVLIVASDQVLGQRLSTNVATVHAHSALLVATILETNAPIAAQATRVSVEFC